MRHSAIGLLVALAAVGAASVPRGALAQTPEQKVAAQVAFDNAIELMKEGKLDKACPLLEDSLRLDRAMGTQYQLSQCYEQAGRYASAWAGYVATADLAKAAGQPERESWARDRAAALEPTLSKLTIVVPAGVASLPELVVERDGMPVPSSLWGRAVPVDGGSHEVAVRARGYQPWTAEVSIAEKEASERVEVSELRAEGAPSAAPPPTSAEGGEPSADEASDDPTVQAAIGGVIAAVGVGVMVAGIAVGLSAKSSYDEADTPPHCIDGLCDAEGLAATDDARASGNLATGLFIGGSVALAAGVITLATAFAGGDDAEEPSPSGRGARLFVAAGPGQAGLGVRGLW